MPWIGYDTNMQGRLFLRSRLDPEDHIHWKLKRSGQNLIQPLLKPFEHNLSQKRSTKRLSSPCKYPFQLLGPNQTQLIGLYWPWFSTVWNLHSAEPWKQDKHPLNRCPFNKGQVTNTEIMWPQETTRLFLECDQKLDQAKINPKPHIKINKFLYATIMSTRFPVRFPAYAGCTNASHDFPIRIKNMVLPRQADSWLSSFSNRHCTGVRTYAEVTTKISRMDRLPNVLSNGTPLSRASLERVELC